VSTADPNAKVWIDTVLRAAHQARQSKGQASGALSVGLDFDMPTKDKKRWGKPHTFVPDTDNLAKLALDAIVKAGLISDDATVSCLIVRKTWAQAGKLSATLSEDRRAPTFIDPERPDWV
jgi:Holliday junction resolvase RusA-like endonuclease